MIDLPAPPDDLLIGAALFLDFDGTLVELADTPDTIEVPPGLGTLLKRLRERLGGRLAIVSGRALDDLERHLPGTETALSGSHGLEIRYAGSAQVPLQVPAGLAVARDAVGALANARAGLLIEDKPAGVALHFRQAPEAGAAVDALMQELGEAHDLIVQRGAMVVELRAAGADKGDAVRGFMREPPFKGARPVFIGDDLTDEHAFTAVVELAGAGILVGPMREMAAHYRLPSVTAVTAWLEQAA